MQSRTYKYVMTKEYVDEFPLAYRQHPAIGSSCRLIHGYSFSMKFYFGSDRLDARNWTYGVEYGGLKDLKTILKDQFDHRLLVAEDDPDMDMFLQLQERNMAKLTVLPKLGCESIADMLYKFMNGVYIPDHLGRDAADNTWCFRVEVRETQTNMAYREGHREWNEDLLND